MGDNVKMKVPEGVNSVSCNGDEFKVAKDGTVEVPSGYVDHLAQHGLTVVPGKPADEAKK